MNKGTLYTSYFVNWRRWKQLKNTFNIAITRYKPKYMDFSKEGIELLQGLAPTNTLLNTYKNGLITENQFRNEFIDYLSINIDSIKDLNEVKKCLDNGTNVLLLYYESKNKFCHRHIIVEIFDEAGYNIKEI
ncbi:DUF488 family protein [Clostridium sardiniense]|uniref:DUF488 family protein, N3 subclade n=1 Tax=Clostridium sardiniense TaxID=29369 RepID=UPI001957C694|nr:DUF488 family protein [Clostridium sardiniense]MBM7836484.1 uncharacterized protein YeaO (DUF488 family) [Clostridium sardiniense]